MWYIKTRHTRHVLRPRSAGFCAAWVAAGLRSTPPPPPPPPPHHCISSFFLALVHHSPGQRRGDGYGCAGSGTCSASRHLEGIKLFEMQVQFSLQELKPLMLPPLPPAHRYDLCFGHWVSLVQVTKEGINALHQRWISVSSSVSDFKGNIFQQSNYGFNFSLYLGFCFFIWCNQNKVVYSVQACVSNLWPKIL